MNNILTWTKDVRKISRSSVLGESFESKTFVLRQKMKIGYATLDEISSMNFFWKACFHFIVVFNSSCIFLNPY